ncbi:MAG: phosphoglucomutase [Methanobacteriota archaeon]|nr:MAG: phosphoglucomutase [Euryarchaeota archaeon]
MLDRHIFRAYDVRGIVNRDLTPDVMAGIGMAFGTYLKGRGRVLVGRDVRVTSELLESAFVSGLLSTGVDVVDTGLVPIPVANFKTMVGDFEAGAYVTASHNPPEYNGVRLRRGDGTGYTEENERVWDIALEGGHRLARWDGIGSVTAIDAEETVNEYRDYLLDRIRIEEPVTTALDIGNGAAYHAAPLVLKEAGARAITINEAPDGRFPNRPSEPNDRTLGALKKMVVDSGADFGVGYDGDADRAMFVDDRGRTVATEKIGILLARDIMERKGPGVVVCNVSCSMIMEEEIERLGGTVRRVRVGDVFVAEAIKEHKALLAIETSAHIFMPEFYVFDDPILATLQVARILSEEGEPLSTIVDGMPSYPYEELNFTCPEEIKFKVMEEIVKGFREQGLELDLTDGVKVNLEEGWILLRPSNTSPKIRAAVEAKDKKGLERLKDMAKKGFEAAKARL